MLVKADGPGWLIIAETLDEGRYRVVRQLWGEEPVTEEIMRFIDTLPRRLAVIEGAEVEVKRPVEDQRRVSPKRAARQAAREVAEARDPGRGREPVGECLTSLGTRIALFVELGAAMTVASMRPRLSSRPLVPDAR